MMNGEANIYNKYNPIFYHSHVLERQRLLTQSMERAVKDGFSLVGFGASAKGNTLLNSLDCVMPEYIVDAGTH